MSKPGVIQTIADQSVSFLKSSDALYPRELRGIFGSLAAPDLTYIGNIELLGERAVGFCGSRKVSDYGLVIASDCAKQLSSADIVVTSGYAKGVDTQSHIAALESGGRTVIVLPEGIAHFRIKKELRSIWDWSRILVLSQFDMVAPWRADRAMERNKLIVGLSNATLVIEAGDKGGTFNAGITALKMRKPLFVVNFSSESAQNRGNRVLLESGGVPVNKGRASGTAEIEKIINSVRS